MIQMDDITKYHPFFYIDSNHLTMYHISNIIKMTKERDNKCYKRIIILIFRLLLHERQ